MTLSACKIWWPGTELNRRRQPFQGCALPPELPGHFVSASLCPHRSARTALPAKRLAANWAVHRARSHWAGCREAKQPMRWDRAELSNYNNPPPFLQNGCGDFRSPVSVSLSFSRSLLPLSHERWPLSEPFMIVSAQRFAPNQYGISR
jgi:hypothetical protein